MGTTEDRLATIQLAADGDEEAFAQLTQIYAARLRWLVKLRIDPVMRARVSADDVLQDALLVASDYIRELVVQDEPAFWSWLCRVVEHRLISAHRKHVGSLRRDARREVRQLDSDQGADIVDFEPAAIDQSSPSEHMRKTEQRELLEQALGKLSSSNREVIILRILEGQSTEQTAELMGRSKGAVSVLLHKAMLRLAEVVDEGKLDLSLGGH